MGASLHEPFLVGDAFVKRVDGILHAWYIFGTRWTGPPDGGQPDRAYKIAHATSTNGIEWRRDAKLIVSDRFGPDECQATPTSVQRMDFARTHLRPTGSATLGPMTSMYGSATTHPPGWMSRLKAGIRTCSATRMFSRVMARYTCFTVETTLAAMVLASRGLRTRGAEAEGLREYERP